MPNLHGKSVLLKELNTLNGQAYTTTDLGLSFIREDSQAAYASLTAVTGSALSGKGSTVVKYHRLALSGLLDIAGVASISSRRITKISLLLDEIARATGIGLQPSDVDDGTIVYDNNNIAIVTLNASHSADTYTGSCQISVQALASDISLSTLITVVDYLTIDVDSTDYVKQLIQANATQRLDWSGLTLSAPMNSPTGSIRNSQATLSALPGSGYSGAVTIFFDRLMFSATGFPDLYLFPQTSAWTGTPWQWLNQFHPTVAQYYNESQFNPTPFTIPAGAVSYVVPAGSPTSSWKLSGGENIKVNPNSANWVGEDLASGWDASIYNTVPFNDYAGLKLTPRATMFGVAGALPTVGAPEAPFSGGLTVPKNCSLFTDPGALPAATLNASWTVDTWYYLDRDIAAPNANPLTPFATGSTVAVTDSGGRIATYQGQSDGAYPGIWLVLRYADVQRTAAANLSFSKKGWHHMAVTYNSTTGVWSYYADGVLVFTLTGTISAGASWYTGFAASFGPSSPGFGVERWRLRKGIKLTGNFVAQDLYPQHYAGTISPLSTVIVNTGLGTLPADTTDRTFLNALTAVGATRIYENDVTIGTPVDHTGPEGNTAITVTAKTGGRYSGSVTVYLNRDGNSAPAIPDQWKFADMTSFAGNALSYLRRYFPTLVPTYFSDWTSQDESTLPTFTIAVGELPPLTLLIARNKYRYKFSATIRVNPKDVHWPGTNLVTAWDTNIYNQAGFVDYAGKNSRVLASVNGVAGQMPVIAGENFAYGNALTMVNSTVGTSDTVPGTAVTNAFTLDCWIRMRGGIPADTLRLPYVLLNAEPNLAAFSATQRLQTGAWDATIGYWAIWNNDFAAKAVSNTKYTAMCLLGWHHIAFVYDGVSTTKLYIDGTLVNTFSYKLVAPAAAIQIGFSSNPNNSIYSIVERYRFRTGVVWNGPFTAADVYA